MDLGKPSLGTVVAFVALFFALGGSAVAARHYLITSTSQIKPSVLKALHGSQGPSGAVGPMGPQGSVGPMGPQGPAGPTNLSTLTTVKGESKSVPKETVATSVATCPSGSHAISGGGYDGLATLAASEMETDHESWFIVVDNEAPISTHVEAVVYCAAAGQAVAASAPRSTHERAVAQADAVAARVAREAKVVRVAR